MGAGATHCGNTHCLPFLHSFCPNLSAISTTLKLSHNVAVSFVPEGWRAVRAGGWETGWQLMAGKGLGRLEPLH